MLWYLPRTSLIEDWINSVPDNNNFSGSALNRSITNSFSHSDTVRRHQQTYTFLDTDAESLTNNTVLLNFGNGR